MTTHGLPKANKFEISKSDIITKLFSIDSTHESIQRILALEIQFRNRIQSHVGALPSSNSKFQKFNTNPFVLMVHCLKRGYSNIKQIENDILPAKEFSSMETSAGRMIEELMLPFYDWETVPSGMHTSNSCLDGKRKTPDRLYLATLKSGPRCLNDEMSENFADAIVNNFTEWAHQHDSKHIDFTYGVLYGTKKQSNKKDWHILRKIKEKIDHESLLVPPDGRWNCSFKRNDIRVDVTIRIGVDWWNHLGGNYCLLELGIALVRACVKPSLHSTSETGYAISDLEDIVSTSGIPHDFNVSILQKSQLPWLFFFYRHFCDSLSPHRKPASDIS